jgi:hypothetical protein
VVLRVVIQAYEGTMLAPEDDGWTGILVFEKVLIRNNFLAASLVVHALELELTQQIPCHPVHLVELALVPAEGT